MRVQRMAALNSSGRDQALAIRLPRFGFMCRGCTRPRLQKTITQTLAHWVRLLTSLAVGFPKRIVEGEQRHGAIA